MMHGWLWKNLRSNEAEVALDKMNWICHGCSHDLHTEDQSSVTVAYSDITSHVLVS